MTDTQILLSEAERLAQVADAVSGAYATELARVLRDLERQLRALAQAALDGSQTALGRAVRAAGLRKEIQTALRAAGFDHLAETATSGVLDTLVDQLARVRGAAKLAAFTTADSSRILALKALARMDVLGVGDAIAHALWRTLAQGLYSQRPLAHILDDLAEALDLEEAKARTLYDTTVSVFTRQVEAMKSSGDADEPFVYVGPVDAVIRPFCREHIGKVYTRKEIDALDNGQLPNTFLTAGGWNCRHTFQAVSKFSALRDLVGTGERMPEIADAIRNLPVGGKKAA